MKIYLVYFSSWDYEDEYSTPIKAFVDETKAELFILDLEEKSKKICDKLEAIYEEHRKLSTPLNNKLRQVKKRKKKDEIIAKLVELSLEKSRKIKEVKKLQKEFGLEDYISTENESFNIEEIELDEEN